jgi:hydroxyacylglutathione hydrolase
MGSADQKVGLSVEIVPCLQDNYAYLVTTGAGIYVVDPSEFAPVHRALAGRELAGILCTHHHFDHVGGVAELRDAFPAVHIVGFEGDRARIPNVTDALVDEDTLRLGESIWLRALHVPGHTSGALTYVLTVEGEAPVAFTGDTLFLAGCGRMFEGTPEQMWTSMQRLRALPDDTRIYCGHEYTAANLRFALSLEPTRTDLTERLAKVQDARARGVFSVPGMLAEERRDNPFLRADDVALRTTLGLGVELAAHDVFAAIRKQKDSFR